MLKGIDISKWQSVDTAKTSGADFVIIKATQGTSYVSPSCDPQYQVAKKAGKKLGVYHYAGGGDPIKEAEYFVKNIKGYIGNTLLALDWESNQNSKFSQHAKWCLPFLNRVYQLTGVRPVIYMSASVIKAADWTPVVKANYGLWVAGYPDDRASWTIPKFPYSIKPWTFWALWQYTSSGGTLDRDVFSGDKAAWDKYAKPVKTTTTTTTKKPATTTTTTTKKPTTTTTTTVRPTTTTTTTIKPGPTDHDKEQDAQISALSALVQKIADFLSSIFSGFKK